MNQLFPVPESERRAALEAAEARACAMMDAIEAAGLVMPGRSEREVEDEIYALAARDIGVKKHWHKRIVRSGPNTLTIAGDNPPVRVIGADDVVYVDLGPVFDAWEADIGRSYMMGDDARSKELVAALPRQFEKVRDHYRANPSITGAALYEFAQDSAREAGFIFGGKIAGHIVSEFAHAHIPGDKALNRIGPANTKPMSDPDGHGRARHWILEIHLVDTARNVGGFYERLL